MNPLNRAPYGRILTGDKSSIFRFEMKKEDLFLVLINPQKHSSMGIFLEASSDLGKIFDQLNQEATLLWGAAFRAEFKLVGSEVLMKKVAPLASQFRWKNVGSSVRSAPSELIYYYYPARVRVADLQRDDQGAIDSPAASSALGSTHFVKKTRVLIVDDSKSVRMLIEQILSRDPQIEIVGLADRYDFGYSYARNGRGEFFKITFAPLSHSHCLTQFHQY
jgi:CheY-like chemotaxis protein